MSGDFRVRNLEYLRARHFRNVRLVLVDSLYVIVCCFFLPLRSLTRDLLLQLLAHNAVRFPVRSNGPYALEKVSVVNGILSRLVIALPVVCIRELPESIVHVVEDAVQVLRFGKVIQFTVLHLRCRQSCVSFGQVHAVYQRMVRR